MSATRRRQAWWAVCLMMGLFAPPLWAAGAVAEAGAVSRAVEVAPPKGWTPDTPLFQEEPSPRSREAAPQVPKGEVVVHAAARRGKPAGGRDSAQPAPTQVKGKAGAATALTAKRGRTQGKAEVKLAVNASKKVGRKAVSRASSKASPKASPKAQVAAGAARSAQAGKKPIAQAPRATSKLRADRQAAERPDRVAANKRSASATKPLSKPATRSAGAAAVRAAKTQQARGKARQGTREPTPARRAPSRGKPDGERVGRSSVKKG